MKCRKMEILGRLYQNAAVLLLVGIFLISCIFTGVYLKDSEAAQVEKENGYKSYTSIEIRSGDSLWSIASEYMTDDYDSVQEYVREIKSLNGLNDDEIQAGRFLLIPYYLHP